jgi:hypothetical protein
MSNTRKVTRPVSARITTPGPTSAKLLLVGALGSAAAMATLVAGGPAATAAAASHDSETVPVSLTADTQPSGQPAAQALPPSTSGTNSSTFSMSDFLSAAATRIQGAASAVNQAFWDGMELQGQAEITNAQANLAMGQGLVNAFPYAVDQATSWGEAGLVRGTIIGGVAGGVIGGAVGTVTVPGVGTGVGLAGGAYVAGPGWRTRTRTRQQRLGARPGNRPDE